MDDIKKQFPIFKNNPELIYLDNAATTQKPQIVLDALNDFYASYNSNVHRGLYPIAEKATDEYESARQAIADFINSDKQEIIFTSGTTDGINGVVASLIKSKLLPPNPSVVSTVLDHHSSIIPLQQIEGVKLDLMEVDEDFQVNFDSDKKYDLASLVHVSNVTGSILDLQIVKKLRQNNPNIIIILDCAQSIAHMPIDVKSLDVDFIAFSGHKIYGPTGIGVLWGRKETLEKMEPFRYGGGMIKEVQKDKSTWAPIPEKFEAGTPQIAQAIALAKAVGFIKEIGLESIQNHEQDLRSEAINKLSKIEGINLYHPSLSIKAAGVISFSVDKIHPHDLAQYLGDQGVCVRAGHHCTQILHRDNFNEPATLRLSLGIYNTLEDLDKLITALEEAIKVFK